MVARGDLGTEFDLADLPHLQKKIIAECIAGGLPVITATQMLDSMIQNSSLQELKLRCRKCCFDGTSAVMLSGETAIGEFPVESVQTMSRIAQRADEAFDYERWAERVAQLRQILKMNRHLPVPRE